MKAKIVESKEAQKALDKAPLETLRAYEIWARLVEQCGTSILRDYKGYHDEKLRGEWEGCRSCRLNRKWRVIYQKDASTNDQLEIVAVIRVTAHDYRRGR